MIGSVINFLELMDRNLGVLQESPIYAFLIANIIRNCIRYHHVRGKSKKFPKRDEKMHIPGEQKDPQSLKPLITFLFELRF